MIGIDVVRFGPAQAANGGGGGRAHAARLRTDRRMLAVRFIPHGYHVNAALGSQQTGPQLGLGLMCEPIAHAEGVF